MKYETGKFNVYHYVLIGCIVILSMIPAATGQTSGGTFVIDRSAIASGGNVATGGTLRLDSTIAQPGAGSELSNPPYTLTGGFFNPLLAPTAASVNVGGRVVFGKDRPIKNVIVSMSGGNLVIPRIARTNQFGYFRLEGIEVGRLYVITVQSKQYGFSQNTQSVMLLDNITDLVFRADWEN